MFEKIGEIDFYRTKNGELVPRYATAKGIETARQVNKANPQAIMDGAFRFDGWANGVFRFTTNESSVIYRDNGEGHYEIQLGLPAPLNKGNGF